jgi:hypothetical protein
MELWVIKEAVGVIFVKKQIPGTEEIIEIRVGSSEAEQGAVNTQVEMAEFSPPSSFWIFLTKNICSSYLFS